MAGRVEISKPESTSVTRPEEGHSGSTKDPWCDLCYDETGQKIDVAGFCPECNSFICKACHEAHKKSPASRNHMIMRGVRMPKSQAEKPVKYPDCGKHIGKSTDYFCLEHGEMICNRCLEVSHPRCTTNTIHDICKSLGSSDVNLLKTNVNNIQQYIMDTRTKIEHNIIDVEMQRKAMVKEAQNLRDEVVKKTEKLCSDLIAEITSVCNKKTADLSHQVLLLADLVRSLKETRSNIDKLTNVEFGPNSFIRVQDITRNAQHFEKEIQSMNKEHAKVEFSLSVSPEVVTFLSSNEKLGDVKETLSKLDTLLPMTKIAFPQPKLQAGKAKPKGKQRDISQIHISKPISMTVRTSGDKEACKVEGMDVTRNGLLLLGDRKNKKVKIFSAKNKFLSEVKLPSLPYDVAIMNEERAIASLDDEKRYILNIGNPSRICIQESIPFGYCVTGMTACDNNLIVIRWNEPRCVKLIDLNGLELWSTLADNHGVQLFKTPYSVATSVINDRPVILVTDWSTETLTFLDASDGRFINAVDLKGKAPRGLTTDDDGNIYVCCSKTNEICVWSADMKQSRILISSNKLQPDPMDVSYNSYTDELLVSYRTADVIDRFQLSKP